MRGEKLDRLTNKLNELKNNSRLKARFEYIRNCNKLNARMMNSNRNNLLEKRKQIAENTTAYKARVNGLMKNKLSNDKRLEKKLAYKEQLENDKDFLQNPIIVPEETEIVTNVEIEEVEK